MGQKVNPIGLRLGINRTWDSRWFAGKGEYGKLLHEDIKIREVLMKQLKQAAVSKIVIERPHKKCRVTIHSARPGVVIGKKGADIDKLRKMVAKMTDSEVVINIVEVRKPEIDATLVADSIAQQLERRVAFRRAMKRAVQSAMRLGAEGIRINCSGRLGGAEIARHGMVSRRAACRCTRCAPMSTTASRRRLRLTAPAASRSGSSRAKSSSTIRWPRTRRWPSKAGGGGERRRARSRPRRGLIRARENQRLSHAATQAHKVPQGSSRAASAALRRAASN
jgi:small subunit ribosomal protein S3